MCDNFYSKKNFLDSTVELKVFCPSEICVVISLLCEGNEEVDVFVTDEGLQTGLPGFRDRPLRPSYEKITSSNRQDVGNTPPL